MRKGFTLVELMVIVGIMAAMVTVSVLSVRAGQDAARLRGAARDIFAAVRQTRSVALLSQQPAVITYSMSETDGEPSAKIEVHSAKLLDTTTGFRAQTLSGESVWVGGDEPTESAKDGSEGAVQRGESVEDVLFAPIDADVLRGVCIKVTRGDEALEYDTTTVKAKSKVSSFSNVDYLLGKFDASRAAKKEAEPEKAEESVTYAVKQEPMSFVWQANGRCESHRIWVYLSGSAPDSGLQIKVDRFGGAKVLDEGEDD